MSNFKASGRCVNIFNWVLVGDKGQGYLAIAAVEESLDEEAIGVFGGSDGSGAIVVEVNEVRVLDESVSVFAD